MAQKQVPWANSLSPARARSDGHHRLSKGPGLVGLWALFLPISGFQWFAGSALALQTEMNFTL